MTSNENINRNSRLIELGGSDFEIADGQPDIRGWSVRDNSGQMIGEVDELLIDPQSLKVRYLVVDLEGNVLDLEPRDVLVPIGIAELHEAKDDVILPGVTAAHFQGLPVYDKDTFTSSTESTIRNAFAGLGAAGAAYAATGGPGEDFYNHELYNQGNLYKRRTAPGQPDTPPDSSASGSIPIIEEDLQVGKREVETGGAIIRSRVREQEVEKDITLREEHVTVDRTPVDRPATEADLAKVKEGEMKITEHAEVPVVDKEARVVEEVRIAKEVEEHDEVIRDTVRKTDVDIENLDPEDPRKTYRQDPQPPLSE